MHSGRARNVARPSMLRFVGFKKFFFQLVAGSAIQYGPARALINATSCTFWGCAQSATRWLRGGAGTGGPMLFAFPHSPPSPQQFPSCVAFVSVQTGHPTCHHLWHPPKQRARALSFPSLPRRALSRRAVALAPRVPSHLGSLVTQRTGARSHAPGGATGRTMRSLGRRHAGSRSSCGTCGDRGEAWG